MPEMLAMLIAGGVLGYIACALCVAVREYDEEDDWFFRK